MGAIVLFVYPSLFCVLCLLMDKNYSFYSHAVDEYDLSIRGKHTHTHTISNPQVGYMQ